MMKSSKSILASLALATTLIACQTAPNDDPAEVLTSWVLMDKVEEVNTLLTRSNHTLRSDNKQLKEMVNLLEKNLSLSDSIIKAQDRTISLQAESISILDKGYKESYHQQRKLEDQIWVYQNWINRHYVPDTTFSNFTY